VSTQANRSRGGPSSRPAGPPSGRASGLSGRVIVFGGLALVVVVAVIVALVSSGGDDGGGASAGEQETAVEVKGEPLSAYDSEARTDDAIGDTVPTVDGEDFDEQPVTVAPDGSPQVVMVLVHSCPHCQAEVPRVVELADQGVFDGVTVTAVPTGTNEDAANYPPSAWLAGEDWPFRVLLDDEQSSAARALGATSVPYFVFLDGDGKVVGRFSGELEAGDLETVISALKAGDRLPLPGVPGASTSTN
jgi:cytochrome c biogenesis protein CcmG, thiol:disulfide interchange protein DsbE